MKQEVCSIITIDEKLCKGCEICIDMCPADVFEISDTLSPNGYYLPVIVKEGDCTYCMLCQKMCPEFAIVVEKAVDEEEEA